MVGLRLREPTTRVGIPDCAGLCRDPFFLMLLRPFRRDPCPKAAEPAVFFTGLTMAVGTKTDLKGRLWRGSPSEMLPWDDTEEVDKVHVVQRPGPRESGKLEAFLKMGMT